MTTLDMRFRNLVCKSLESRGEVSYKSPRMLQAELEADSGWNTEKKNADRNMYSKVQA